jgi:hypothetical protein
MRSLAQKIGVAHDDWMQDWPLEVADANRIEEFIDFYEAEESVDFRQLLAELITFSIEELFDHAPPSETVLRRAASVLREHDDILTYWSCEGAVSSDEQSRITPWVRTIKAEKASTK